MKDSPSTHLGGDVLGGATEGIGPMGVSDDSFFAQPEICQANIA